MEDQRESTAKAASCICSKNEEHINKVWMMTVKMMPKYEASRDHVLSISYAIWFKVWCEQSFNIFLVNFFITKWNKFGIVCLFSHQVVGKIIFLFQTKWALNRFCYSSQDNQDLCRVQSDCIYQLLQFHSCEKTFLGEIFK